jgi:hypothetical protein
MVTNLQQVIRILGVIEKQPNIREAPRPGDIPGDFDRWFDGGAITFVTGTTKYTFSDGSEAWVAVLRELWITVRLSDGSTFNITERAAFEPPTFHARLTRIERQPILRQSISTGALDDSIVHHLPS